MSSSLSVNIIIIMIVIIIIVTCHNEEDTLLVTPLPSMNKYIILPSFLPSIVSSCYLFPKIENYVQRQRNDLFSFDLLLQLKVSSFSAISCILTIFKIQKGGEGEKITCIIVVIKGWLKKGNNFLSLQSSSLKLRLRKEGEEV